MVTMSLGRPRPIPGGGAVWTGALRLSLPVACGALAWLLFLAVGPLIAATVALPLTALLTALTFRSAPGAPPHPLAEAAEDGERVYDVAPWTVTPWYFELRLGEEARRCVRYGDALAVVYIGLPADQLAVAGDIEQVAKSLSRRLRPFDVVAGLGPGEFALCLIRCNGEVAAGVCARVIEGLRVSAVRVGIAVCPDDGADAHTLVRLARQSARTLAVPEPVA